MRTNISNGSGNKKFKGGRICFAPDHGCDGDHSAFFSESKTIFGHCRVPRMVGKSKRVSCISVDCVLIILYHTR